MREEIDIIDSITKAKIHFILNPSFWDNFDESLKGELQEKWSEVKFLREDNQLHESMNTIPKDKGGIYVFIVKSDIVPTSHLYIMYIGRARFSTVQNLRKRCKEYLNETRPKIARLIKCWGKYLYIRYLPLDDNSLIDNLERELINKIIPPFNDLIPDKDIRDAVKAFSM